MKILILFFISLLGSEINVTLKDTISLGNYKAYYTPYILKNTKTGQNLLFTYFYNDDNGYLKVFNSKRETVFSFRIKDAGVHDRSCFVDDNHYYFFSEKLYILNIDNLSIDSVKLKRDDYRSVSIHQFDKQRILIAQSLHNLDLYDFKNFQLVKSFPVNFKNSDKVIVSDGILYYMKEINEIAAVDIAEGKEKWKFNSGMSEVRMLGIRLGSFKNFISSYNIIKDGGQKILYVTAATGDLYKLDALSGKVLLKKERFRGDDNNAGLITDLQFADINGDGAVELIGTSVDNNIYCINGKNFSIIWSYDTGDQNQTSATLYDINGDSIPDVFNINDAMTLSILNGKNGQCIKKIQLTSERTQSVPVIANLWGNNTLNLILKANNHEIKIYELR